MRITLGIVAVTLFFLMGGPGFLWAHQNAFSYMSFAAVGVAIWWLFKLTRRRKAFKAELGAAIREVSGVTDANCIDICIGDAIALNYHNRSVYVILNGSDIRRIAYDKVLEWEYADKNDPSAHYGDVINGAALGMFSPQAEMRMASMGAMGTAAALTVVGTAINKTDDVGTLRLSVNDHSNPFATLSISRGDFIDRLRHFFAYCKANS